MKRLINLLIWIFAIGSLHAQNDDTAYPHVIPMTPQAAELAKYADSPISYYTGTPNISIPLYEIEVDGLKLPISLNYNASGIRVDQEATWVGLGWSLDVGSRISRTVKSSDDFHMSWDRSYPHVLAGYYDAPEITTDRDNHYVEHGYPDCSATWGSIQDDLVYDPEPDIFYYNLPNMNGKFILDKSRGAVLFDKSHNLKIEVIRSGSVTFKVTDKEGNQYLYNQWEITKNYTTNGWLNKNLHTSNTVYDDNYTNYATWDLIRLPDCTPEYVASAQEPYPMVTSWCLTKIITKNGREIEFFYDPEVQHLPTQESSEKYSFNGQSWLYYNRSKVVNNALRLYAVEGDFGRIEFNTSDRFDMKVTNLRSKKLESLSIYNNTNKLIKSYKFDYSYFNDDYTGNYQYEHVFKRLKLNNVTEYNLNASSSLVPLNSGYTFDYYAGNFPAKNSKNVDYWGFQNGREYGENYHIGLRINNTLTFNGVKKDANFEKAIIGTLKKITFPTGGTAEYKFESNKIPFGYFEDHTYEWLPGTPGANNLLSLDVFNYYISTDHYLYADLPSQKVTTFTIQEQTKVKINCELENTMQTMDATYTYDSDSNPLGRLRRISPTTNTYYTYRCPFLWDYTASAPQGQGSEATLTEREFTLEPGTYEFQAYQPPRDVLASWRLHFDRPLPSEDDPGTPPGLYDAGGVRISEIMTNAKVRKFNYATGTMMRQPILYYMGRRGVMPAHIASSFVQVSESQTPLSSFNRGNFVGYDWVEEFLEDEEGNISKTRYTFHNDPETELFDDSFPDSPYYLNYTNGLPKSIEIFKTEAGSNPMLIKKDEFFYSSTYSSTINAFRDRGQKRHDDDLLPYNYQLEWPLETQHVETTIADGGQSITKEINYEYNSKDLIELTSYEINSEEIVEKVRYPFDFGDAVSLAMVSKNMIGMPVESITLRDGNVIKGTKTQYEDVAGLHLPKTVFKTEINTTDVSELNYNSYYQPFLNFDKYDVRGNLLEVSQPINGLHTFYVWGYNKQYPIAKIENFNSEVNMTSEIQNLINNAEAVSESDDDNCTDNANCNEKNLRIALNQLRNAFISWAANINAASAHAIVPEPVLSPIVTTYTYDPLIGITSVTDPNNVTTYYEYDSFGRLNLMKDNFGNILKRYNYSYKND